VTGGLIKKMATPLLDSIGLWAFFWFVAFCWRKINQKILTTNQNSNNQKNKSSDACMATDACISQQLSTEWTFVCACVPLCLCFSVQHKGCVNIKCKRCKIRWGDAKIKLQINSINSALPLM
jgi:hypothetical protein